MTDTPDADMNVTEHRIEAAAPVLNPENPGLTAAELQRLLIPGDGPDQLAPGNAAAYHAAEARRGSRWRRRSPGLVLRFVLFAALAAVGLPQLLDQRGGEVPGTAAGVAAEGTAALWRTAVITRPWSSGPQVSASFELPVDWQVWRHRTSKEFPGLHASVRDRHGLTVAMLYLGPAPAGAYARTCVSGPAGSLELDRQLLTTGAEQLDARLKHAYSYSLDPGEETRGTFGLVPVGPDHAPCAVGMAAVPEGQLLLQFGDALRVPLDGSTPVPRSGYGRTFAVDDDARRYLRSADYNVIRRMITSLQVVVPPDTSALWEIPAQGSRRAMGLTG